MPASLTDQPVLLANDWKGYLRKIDPTVQPFNTLAFPSINCTVPEIDKVVPDKGKTLVGQQFTENSGMIGNKKMFTNLGGQVLEVRVWRSLLVPAKNDVIEVLYQNNWLQITEDTNPIPVGAHRYSMDDWWDSNLMPAESKNLSRLVWVNGYQDPSTKQGRVYSWTGGITAIIGVTPTTLTISATTTWRSLGFTEDAANNAYVVVHGISHQLTNPADLDTSVINVASTAGIVNGDIATSRIEEDIVPIPFDYCCENKGYMFYGNWLFQKLYQSNGFNDVARQEIIQSQALQNDLSITNSSSYTGTGSHRYKILITAVHPASNTQFFTGTGIDDGTYDTSAYTGVGNNTYKLTMVANFGFTFVGNPAIIPNSGDILTGSISGAIGRVAFLDSGGQDPQLVLLSANGFVPNDIISGSQGTPYGTVATATWEDWFQLYKNNVAITPIGYVPFIAYGLNPSISPQTVSFVDNLSITFQNATGHTPGDSFTLNLQTGAPDEFTIQLDQNTPSAPVSITGGVQNIAPGIDIIFAGTTGHIVGDYWIIQVDQAITRAWVNFYETLPIRKVGEGHIYQLASNFWTMGVQEEQIYVNMSYGQWAVVNSLLSGDQQTESLSLTPLKQASSNKVIDPWLIGNMENDLVYVTVDKNLDYIGRLQLYQLPQVDNLSDPVKLDFLECDFTGGGIEYIGKRMYITSPPQGLALCYDNLKKYWQAPKSFTEIGIPSIVGNDLFMHSNTRNQSFTMFTSTAGDNGAAYAVRIRTPYSSVGSRWKSKNSSMSFIEGYITGNPILTHRVYLGVAGCGGIFPHTVAPPAICVPPDRAPFGAGSFGSHSNGSDVFSQGSYFQEIWKGYAPILQYYFIAFELECISTNHTWALLSMGVNAIWSNTGNNNLVNQANVVQ